MDQVRGAPLGQARVLSPFSTAHPEHSWCFMKDSTCGTQVSQCCRGAGVQGRQGPCMGAGWGAGVQGQGAEREQGEVQGRMGQGAGNKGSRVGCRGARAGCRKGSRVGYRGVKAGFDRVGHRGARAGCGQCGAGLTWVQRCSVKRWQGQSGVQGG